MTRTTHSEFGADTEAIEVAAAFPEAIRGKTILITGVNRAGLGYATAEAFASQGPAHLIFGGRTLSKLHESIQQLQNQYRSIDYRPLVVDLSSQSSVRTAAQEVLSWKDIPKIDIVVNNAGIMNVPKLILTPDAQLESHFATNHIGHFLLTNLLMPKLLVAAKEGLPGATRIVNVSSSSMRDGGIRFSDINFTKPQNHLPEDERHIEEAIKMSTGGLFDPDVDTYLPSSAYAQSKAANVLFSVELTKRLYRSHGILSVSLHPGLIWTELTRLFTQERLDRVKGFVNQGLLKAKNQEAGAATSLVAALDPALDEIVFDGKGDDRKRHGAWGAFLTDCQIVEAPYFAAGSEPAARLWKLSEVLVGENFTW